MVHALATQNITIREIQSVLLVIILVNNVLALHLPHVQFVTLQNFVLLMEMEGVSVWTNTTIQDLISYVQFVIINVKHA